jgi:hypothetical protein
MRRFTVFVAMAYSRVVRPPVTLLDVVASELDRQCSDVYPYWARAEIARLAVSRYPPGRLPSERTFERSMRWLRRMGHLPG